MITDDELRQKEAEVEALFGGGLPWASETSEDSRASEERVHKIMLRVKIESLGKDSVSFIFKSFGTTLGGVAKVLFKALPEPPRSPSDRAED
jgi:hypothetical protein